MTQPRLVEGETSQRVQVMLPESLVKELKELAEKESRSVSNVGRVAIEQYLFLNRARKH